VITLERLKNIAEDIIADDDWVNDSLSKSEHEGIKAGLYALIHHLEEVDDELWIMQWCWVDRYIQYPRPSARDTKMWWL